MAKERAAKLHTKAEKPEKKVSKDKVKKEKKEKKSKPVETPEESEDEPSKLEEAAEESSAESEPEVKPKKDKKKKKESDEKVEKSKKKEKKTKKTAAAEDEVAEDNEDDDDNGAPLFAIDTNPTPIDPNSLPEKAADEMDVDADEEEEEKNRGHTKSPKGLNRHARRRIRLIETQREKIQKQLGVPVGSSERADEVQAKLDRWVQSYDDKARAREEKKERRKAKEAARIRNKKGKVLTGRRLTERKKQLDKMEKKGLSAQHST